MVCVLLSRRHEILNLDLLYYLERSLINSLLTVTNNFIIIWFGYQRLHVFPRLALVARFPAFGTGCMFPRAWHWFHVFLRLALVARFLELGTSCTFSLRLALVARFPALCTVGYTFCYAWHQLLGTGCMFTRI